MLEMDERRLNYVDQLMPPNGYVPDYAVGTTYSLDLGALLGICISVTMQMTSGDPSEANRVKLFAAAARAISNPCSTNTFIWYTREILRMPTGKLLASAWEPIGLRACTRQRLGCRSRLSRRFAIRQWGIAMRQPNQEELLAMLQRKFDTDFAETDFKELFVNLCSVVARFSSGRKHADN